jgi:hypothetical protein
MTSFSVADKITPAPRHVVDAPVAGSAPSEAGLLRLSVAAKVSGYGQFRIRPGVCKNKGRPDFSRGYKLFIFDSPCGERMNFRELLP